MFFIVSYTGRFSGSGASPLYAIRCSKRISEGIGHDDYVLVTSHSSGIAAAVVKCGPFENFDVKAVSSGRSRLGNPRLDVLCVAERIYAKYTGDRMLGRMLDPKTGVLSEAWARKLTSNALSEEKSGTLVDRCIEMTVDDVPAPSIDSALPCEM
jgi:hypothetical protein